MKPASVADPRRMRPEVRAEPIPAIGKRHDVDVAMHQGTPRETNANDALTIRPGQSCYAETA